MKTAALLIILTFAACVAYVAATAGTAGAGAEDPPLRPYKCYQARHAKRSPRFQPERVFITDQFRDNVEVNVLKLAVHCSSADQRIAYTGSPASGFNRGLDCYAVRDVPGQPRFRAQRIDIVDNKLGEQVLTVSKVTNLCVSGVKLGKFGLNVEGGGFVCYQARTTKGTPRFQPRDILVQDQSGEKRARVLRPVAYCSDMTKKLEADNDAIEDAENISKYILKGPDPLEFHVSTVHATPGNTDPIITCKTDYTHSVWYRLDPQENKSLILDTSNSTYDTVLAVFQGSIGNLHEIACNDDQGFCGGSPGGAAGNCPCPDGNAAGFGCCTVITGDGGPAGRNCTFPTTSYLQFDAWAGNTYYILVGSSDGHGGKLKLNFRAKEQVGSADSCTTPYLLPPAGFIGEEILIHLSSMNATFLNGVSVAGGPCSPSEDPGLGCVNEYGASVWFTYTPGAHQVVNFDTTASSYPTVIAIFDLTDPGQSCGSYGYLSATLKADHKYLILVGSTDEDNDFRGGKLKLDYTVKDQIGDTLGETAAPIYNGLVCYSVRQARHTTQIEEIFDQFSARQIDDPWLLSIGSVDSVCLPVAKQTCTRTIDILGEQDGEAARICVNT